MSDNCMRYNATDISYDVRQGVNISISHHTRN